MRTIAIANQKGGVGKTTTAVTLAHALAINGYQVVLVDLDAQGNASASLGREPSPGLFELLTNTRPIADILVNVRENLWLLPGDTNTAKLKLTLAGESYREKILANALAQLDADFVVLDTGPSRDLLHDMAHHAASQVVIPASVEYLSLVGVAQEVDTLKSVRDHGHPVEVIAIQPTFFDSITIESTTNLQHLVDSFGDLVLPAVPRTTKLREAPAYGKTLWEYLPAGHTACVAYGHLVRRIVDAETTD